LKNAKRPVILLGSQATLPPMPAEKLREALEKMNAPCFLGGMARGLLGKDSEIQFKHCRKEALKEADVVVLAGTVADFRLGYGKVLSKKSKIITINRSKEQLTKVIYFLVLISNWCPYVPEIIHYPLIFV